MVELNVANVKTRVRFPSVAPYNPAVVPIGRTVD